MEEYDEENQNRQCSVSVADEGAQENFKPCEEKANLKHVPSLFEKYVSVKRISPGVIGNRPHFYSLCTFIVESALLLDSTFTNSFQSSTVFSVDSRDKEINLCLGSSDTELDRALEFALLDMWEGERSELILRATQRTGKQRDQDGIPVPCVKCVIKLKKVTQVSTDCKNNYRYSLLSATEEEKYLSALKDKAVGVELFQKLRFVDAFHRFSAGAKTLMTSDSFLFEPEDKSKKIFNLFSVLCSNMAECQLRENNPLRAMSLCQRALIHDSNNLKALYRQASACWMVGKVDEAQLLLIKLLKLDPSNIAGKRLYNEVQFKIREYEQEYTKMMKRIFNT